MQLLSSQKILGRMFSQWREKILHGPDDESVKIFRAEPEKHYNDERSESRAIGWRTPRASRSTTTQTG
jgi:hypothetical protein